MKIIVTGCKGQLGTEILKQLREGRSEIGPIPEKLLNATVIADGTGNGGFVLCNAAVLTAGEHIIGGDVYQSCTGLFRCSMPR